jgi:hypothetical protein
LFHLSLQNRPSEPIKRLIARTKNAVRGEHHGQRAPRQRLASELPQTTGVEMEDRPARGGHEGQPRNAENLKSGLPCSGLGPAEHRDHSRGSAHNERERGERAKDDLGQHLVLSFSTLKIR